MTRDSIDFFIRVKKEELYLLCPYFESFEGLAAIRIPYPEEGIYAKLKLMVSPDFTAAMETLLANLEKRIWLERIPGEA